MLIFKGKELENESSLQELAIGDRSELGMILKKFEISLKVVHSEKRYKLLVKCTDSILVGESIRFSSNIQRSADSSWPLAFFSSCTCCLFSVSNSQIQNRRDHRYQSPSSNSSHRCFVHRRLSSFWDRHCLFSMLEIGGRSKCLTSTKYPCINQGWDPQADQPVGSKQKHYRFNSQGTHRNPFGSPSREIESCAWASQATFQESSYTRGLWVDFEKS